MLSLEPVCERMFTIPDKRVAVLRIKTVLNNLDFLNRTRNQREVGAGSTDTTQRIADRHTIYNVRDFTGTAAADKYFARRRRLHARHLLEEVVYSLNGAMLDRLLRDGDLVTRREFINDVASAGNRDRLTDIGHTFVELLRYFRGQICSNRNFRDFDRLIIEVRDLQRIHARIKVKNLEIAVHVRLGAELGVGDRHRRPDNSLTGCFVG